MGMRPKLPKPACYPGGPLIIESIQRPASAHGWLRRPELDEPNWDAWEKPDGTLHAAEIGREPALMTLPPGTLNQLGGRK